MLNRIKKFFEEARQEFKHVNWPTRQEVVRLTFIVIGISLIITVFLGVFDTSFQFLLEKFIINQ